MTVAAVAKVDSELGVVFGWAVCCSTNGDPYVDLQGQVVPESVMLKASHDFMQGSPITKVMHVGDAAGRVLFAFPLTSEIAKAMGLNTQITGLMIGAKFDDKTVLEKFRDGTYSGFSIGGTARLEDLT